MRFHSMGLRRKCGYPRVVLPNSYKFIFPKLGTYKFILSQPGRSYLAIRQQDTIFVYFPSTREAGFGAGIVYGNNRHRWFWPREQNKLKESYLHSLRLGALLFRDQAEHVPCGMVVKLKPSFSWLTLMTKATPKYGIEKMALFIST